MSNKRAELLQNAEKAINGDRDAVYGSADVNFTRIAALLNSMGYQFQSFDGKARGLNSTDVALIMTQVKLSRLVNTPEHEDSWMDAAGYIALGGEIALSGGTKEVVFKLNAPAAGKYPAVFECQLCGFHLLLSNAPLHTSDCHGTEKWFVEEGEVMPPTQVRFNWAGNRKTHDVWSNLICSDCGEVINYINVQNHLDRAHPNNVTNYTIPSSNE